MFHRLVMLACRVLFGIPYRLRSEGAERIPGQGGVIVSANHVSYWDAVFLQLSCPRRLRWMIDEEYYRLPVLHGLFKAVGCIPVSGSGGNRQALQAAIDALREGEAVGIFPEGRLSRTGRMGRFRTGVALLAARTGAAVVPAYLRGAFFTWPKGQALPRLSRVEVRFGEPMRLAREEAGREALQAFADRLMGAVKGLYGHRVPA